MDIPATHSKERATEKGGADINLVLYLSKISNNGYLFYLSSSAEREVWSTRTAKQTISSACVRCPPQQARTSGAGPGCGYEKRARSGGCTHWCVAGFVPA